MKMLCLYHSISKFSFKNISYNYLHSKLTFKLKRSEIQKKKIINKKIMKMITVIIKEYSIKWALSMQNQIQSTMKCVIVLFWCGIKFYSTAESKPQRSCHRHSSVRYTPTTMPTFIPLFLCPTNRQTI